MNSENRTIANPSPVHRRGFFQQVGGGICGAALLSLLGDERVGELYAKDVAGSEEQRGVANVNPRQPHFAPRAKAVIHLFMNGGPSQMDLFDAKPELTKRHGQSYFERIAGEVENPTSGTPEQGAGVRRWVWMLQFFID